MEERQVSPDVFGTRFQNELSILQKPFLSTTSSVYRNLQRACGLTEHVTVMGR